MVDVKEWQVGDVLIVDKRRLSNFKGYVFHRGDKFISLKDVNKSHVYQISPQFFCLVKNITAIERELAELRREKEEDFNLFGVEMD